MAWGAALFSEGGCQMGCQDFDELGKNFRISADYVAAFEIGVVALEIADQTAGFRSWASRGQPGCPGG